MPVSIGVVEGEIILRDKFTRVIDTAASKLALASAKLSLVGDHMASVGRTLSTSITLPLVALGTLAVRSAIQFESSFTGVRKTVEATAAEFDVLEGEFRDLAREIPLSVNAINAIGEAAGQLGIKQEDILAFTRVMADLGVTTNLSADEAAVSLARLANITGLSSNDFERLGSTIVALGNSFAANEQEIVSMTLRLAASGTQIGLNEGQIIALSTAMISMGINAEAGGTSMSRVMLDMQRSIALNSDELALFAEAAGLSIEEFTRLFEEDAAAAIEAFIVGLGNMTNSEAILMLDNLGLSGARVTRTLLSLANGSDTLVRAFDEQAVAWEENSALAIEAALRYGTTESQLAIMWNRLNDVGITLGEIMIPMMTSLIETLVSAVEWFGNWDIVTQSVIIALLATIAAVGPLALGIGMLITLVGNLGIQITLATGIIGLLVLAFVAAAAAISAWSDSMQQDIDDIVIGMTGFTDGINAFKVAVESVIEGNSLSEMKDLLVEQNTALDAARIAFDATTAEVTRLEEASIRTTGSTDAFSVAIDAAKVLVNEANIEVGALETSTGKLEKAIDDWKDSTEEVESALGDLGGSGGAISTMTAAMRAVLEETNEWQVKINELNAAIAAEIMLADTLSMSVDSVEMSEQELVETIAALVDEMLEGVDASTGYAEGLDFIKDKANRAGDALTGFGLKVSEFSQTLDRVQQRLQAVGGVIDQVFGEGTHDKISNIVGIGQDAAGAYAAFASGDIWGGITRGVSAVTGAFNTLFPSTVLVEERITSMLAKMADGKGTIEDLEKVSHDLWRTLEKVALEGWSASRAADIMNESFGDFVDVAREMGEAGLTEIAKVVAAAEAAGTGLEAIAVKLSEAYTEAFDIMAERSTFITEQVTNLTDALTILISDSFAATEADVRFVEGSVIAAFGAMLESGMTFLEAISSISELFNLTNERALELGVTLSDEFNRFGELIEIIQSGPISRMIEKLTNTGIAVEALTNLGLLTEEQFWRLQRQINNMGDDLIEAGATGSEAIASMAPQLQILLDASQQYGFSIDEGTQKLIAQAMEMGLVTDQALTMEDIMINAFDALLAGVNALIVALGGVPLAFDNWNSSVDTTADNFSTQLGTMGDNFDRFTDDMILGYDIAMGDITDKTTTTTLAVDEAWRVSLTNVSSSVEMLGAVTVTVFDFVAQTSLSQANATTSSWRDAVEAIRANYNNVIGGLAPPPSVPSGGGGNPVPPIPQFHGGSDGYIDFGAGGTRIDVHDNEQITTRRQGVSIADDVGIAISHALRARGGDGSNGNDGVRLTARILNDILTELKRNTNSFDRVAGEVSAMKARDNTSRNTFTSGNTFTR